MSFLVNFLLENKINKLFENIWIEKKYTISKQITKIDIIFVFLSFFLFLLKNNDILGVSRLGKKFNSFCSNKRITNWKIRTQTVFLYSFLPCFTPNKKTFSVISIKNYLSKIFLFLKYYLKKQTHKQWPNIVKNVA